MNNFLNRFQGSVMGFMQGRYGIDKLGLFTLAVAIVCMVLGSFVAGFFNIVALVVLIIGIVRCYSRNIAARTAENERFLELTEKPRALFRMNKGRIENRKTTAYIKCPSCKKTFTVPKGKGKIRAVCPHCHESSIHTV